MICAHAAAGDTVTYAYDALGRLVSATTEGKGVIYRYDAVGNLVSITANNSPLAITALQPGSGVAGATVTISGTGFATAAGDNAVKFNGVSAVIQSASATQIVAQVPVGATTGYVSVTTAAGTTISPMAFHIDSAGPPSIIEITPAVAATGSSVTINGANFDTSAKVFFGNTFGPYRTASAASLAVDVPARAESGKIEVSTVNGTARSTVDFLVAPPGISPANVSETGRLTFGLPRTLNLAQAGQKAMLLFDGVAGQKVSLHIGPSTMSSANASILAPGNATVGASNFNASGGFIDALTLPVTGTYTVLINPSSTAAGTPTITLYTFTDLTGGIVAGGPAAPVVTTVPGQNASLTFGGSAGQRISTLISGVSFAGGSNLYLSLLKPDGNILVGSNLVTSSGGFLDTQVLPVSGTYTLLLDPRGAALAKAAVQLYDVPANPSVSAVVGGAPVPIATTVPGQNAAIVFEGVAGQRISALVNGVSFTGGSSLYLSLSTPDGSVMVDSLFVTSSGAFVDTQTLPASGTYTLLFDPKSSALANATVQLYDVPANPSVSATVGGAPVQIATTVPGQNATIMFEGVAGQRISALVNGVSFIAGSSLYLSVRKPDGSIMVDSLFVTSGGAFIDPQTLPASGTYTLLLDPKGSALAKATLQLFDVPPVAQLTTTIGGAATAITTTVPGQTASLTFTGSTGQSVSIAATGNTMGCLDISVRKPDGSTLISKRPCGTSFTITPLVLSASGDYSIQINPNGANVGAMTIRITSP